MHEDNFINLDAIWSQEWHQAEVGMKLKILPVWKVI